MAVLTWNNPVDHKYKVGVSKGVLFVDGVGTAWSGLISVEESAASVQTTRHFWDGSNHANIASRAAYAGSIRAFTYPDQFEPCIGHEAYQPGLTLTAQQPKQFGLAYRVELGDAVNGHGSRYEIHVLYNLVASAQAVPAQTMTATPTPVIFAWNVVGRPEKSSFLNPTAHVVIDSEDTDPGRLSTIEDLLFGSEAFDSRLPSLEELLDLATITVIDNGDGSATVDGPDYLVVYEGNGEATFYNIDATVIDAETIEIKSTGE